MKKNVLPHLLTLSVFALSIASCGGQGGTSGASSEEASVSSSVEPIHEHAYVRHEAVAPTCVQAGKKAYYSCSGCDLIFAEDKTETTEAALVEAALGHDAQHHDAVAGTDCEHKGTIEHYSCSRCDLLFSDAACEHEISSIEGDYGEHTYTHHDAVDPTCVDAGVAEHYTCDVCSAVFDADKAPATAESLAIPALGHDAQHHDAVAGSDCQHKGTVEYYSCSRCDLLFSDEACEHVIQSIEGDFGAHHAVHHDAVAGSDCQHKGTVEYYSCENCDLLFSDEACEHVISSIEGEYGEHTYTHHDAVASTCTVNGKEAHYTCDICNGIFDENHEPTTEEAITLPLLKHVTHYAHDDESHWEECGDCDYKTESVAHEYGAYQLGEAIGTMTSACVCGAERHRIAANEDFNLGEDLFGSSVTTSSSETTKVGKNGVNYQYYEFGRDGGSSETYLLNLPRIEFKNYSSVTIAFQIASGWFTFGSDASHTVRANGDKATGSIHAQKRADGSVHVDFAFNNDSDYPGTPIALSYELTDEGILNGTAPMSLYATGANNALRTVFLTSIVLEETCAHNMAYVADEEIIGVSHNTECLKCGAKNENPTSRTSETGDVNYAVSTHGATLERIKGGAGKDEYPVENAVSGTDSAAVYAPDGDYVCFRARMPKVNYALYSSVSFPLSVGDAHYGMSLTGGIWNESTGIHGKNLSVTLSIAVNGENSLAVQLIWGDEIISTTIEDANVYNGSAGVPVYFSVSSTAALRVGSPTLTLAE